MMPTRNVLSRRQLLKSSAASCFAATLGPHPTLFGSAPAEPTVAFFVLSDTHYLANRDQPQSMDAASRSICGNLVDILNRLPGQPIPDEAGGGVVCKPMGVIHAGDVIDTGDKQGGVTAQMQQTEWGTFVDDFGLKGGDGKLLYPVYELHGNHDSPRGTGWAIEQICKRNPDRPNVSHISENGLHYSWDWNGVHFVNLGLIVGNDRTVTRKRRYAAFDSLDFLIKDLREHVGESRRPVILSHHIDIARYTVPCDPQAEPDSKEWDACDVQAFYRAIKDYPIAGIFYGHTHVRNVFNWDGASPQAASGIHVFNSDNASHFSGDAQAFFYVELYPDRLVVREYQTKDRWVTGSFTPQYWSVPVAG